jgi:hypothetical protein
MTQQPGYSPYDPVPGRPEAADPYGAVPGEPSPRSGNGRHSTPAYPGDPGEPGYPGYPATPGLGARGFGADGFRADGYGADGFGARGGAGGHPPSPAEPPGWPGGGSSSETRFGRGAGRPTDLSGWVRAQDAASGRPAPDDRFGAPTRRDGYGGADLTDPYGMPAQRAPHGGSDLTDPYGMPAQRGSDVTDPYGMPAQRGSDVTDPYGMPAQRPPYREPTDAGPAADRANPQPGSPPDSASRGEPARHGADEPARSGTNRFAIASVIFGAIGGFLLGAAFGVVALRQIRHTRQGGRRLAQAGLALSGVWLVVIAVSVLVSVIGDDGEGALDSGDGTSVASADLAPGDCLNGLAESDRVASVPSVPCAQPHEGEVFATFEISAPSWPGDAAITKQAEAGCVQKLAEYSPKAAADEKLEIFFLHPTERSWGQGDHEVTCVAIDPARRTGSLRD